MIPIPLLPAFALASWSVSTRGEPGGRGRWLRATRIVAGALVIGVAGFVVVSLAAQRIVGGAGVGRLLPSPAAPRALLVNGLGGPGELVSLVDARDGSRLRYLGGTMRVEAAWRDDGDRFALLQDVGTFGAVRDARVSIRSGHDGKELTFVRVPSTSDGMALLGDMRWCGPRLFANDWNDAPLVFEPGSEALEPIDGLEPDRTRVHRILGCAADESLLVVWFDPSEVRRWGLTSIGTW